MSVEGKMLSKDISEIFWREEISLATAESCTAGNIAATLTATSGIAGPTGGTPDKPIGTVWIAAGNKDNVITEKICEDNGREQNVHNASIKALYLLRELCQNQENNEEK